LSFGPSRYRRLIAWSAAIAVHMLAFYAITQSGNQTKHPESPAIAWIDLAHVTPEPLESPHTSTTLPGTWTQHRVVPPTPPNLPIIPDPTATQEDATRAALRAYIVCSIPFNGPLNLEQRQHCEEVRRNLSKEPFQQLPPTEEERNMARKFAEESDAQNGCITPVRPGARHQPQRGVTGIPDSSGGLPNRLAQMQHVIDPTAPRCELRR